MYKPGFVNLKSFKTVFFIAFICLIPRIATDNESEECKQIKSCSSCISKSNCVWCVTKSICTKQECGNDNIIYPDNVAAIMAGSSFCPRVAETDVWTIKSGTRNSIIVKITQIHLYMAFTPWKCKIDIDDRSNIVNAILLGDAVHCESMLFDYTSNIPHMNGSVTVLWDYTKHFDGTKPIKVCRCDLDTNCKACK